MWEWIISAKHTTVIHWDLDPHSNLTLHSFMNKEMVFSHGLSLVYLMGQGQDQTSLDNARYLDTQFTVL